MTTTTTRKSSRSSMGKGKASAPEKRATRSSTAKTPVKASSAYPTPPPSASSTRSSRSVSSVDTPTKRGRPARLLVLEDADCGSDDEMDMLRKVDKGKRKMFEGPYSPAPPPMLNLPSSSAGSPAISQGTGDQLFDIPSLSGGQDDEEVTEALILPSPAKTPSAKRRRIFIPEQKAPDSDDEESPAGDENRPLSFATYGTVEEVVEPHRTQYPASDGLRLLDKVSDVLYSRSLPPMLAHEPPTSRAELAAVPCLPCLETWEIDVRLQLDRTVRDGEGNCMVILGPRGVGKTAIIKRSLSLLQESHGADSFITINLSGLTSTTDRTTLREIARQLCRDEHGLGDDGSSFTSHAVILRSLLALLEPESSTASASTSLDRAKPVLFVLDHFHLFAERDDRQSFLYCLLDIVQSKRRKGGMAVVGVSSRVDCLDRLEKRVRSRCQSRVLRVLPPATLEEFASIARIGLTCENDGSHLAADWNTSVEDFISQDDTQRALKDLFDLRANTGELLQNLGMMVRHQIRLISNGSKFAVPCLKAADLPVCQSAPERFGLSSLSQACLTVLIAAKHVTASASKPFITPNALWDRYYQYARSEAASKQRPYPLAVFTRALEHLCHLEAIVDANPTSATGTVSAHAAAQATSSWRRLRTVIWPSELDAVVKSRKDLPVHLRQWAIRG